MMQTSHPLPDGMPVCVPGHRPQLVVTRGAPRGHRIGTPCPPQWHVECAQCGVATVPGADQAHALLCWRAPADLFRIPLSKLADVRARVAHTLSHAA